MSSPRAATGEEGTTVTEDASSPSGACPNSGKGDGHQRFGAGARVADIIAADPAVVDRLIAISPAFTLLRDPATVQTTGRFVTLREAAGIAGVSVACLVAAANGEQRGSCAAGDTVPNDDGEPDWFPSFDESTAPVIDVRPVIGEDQCPFSAVMGLAARVPLAGGLVIDAPFNPVPLRRALADKGFATHARQQTETHWRVWCHRQTAPPGSRAAEIGPATWQAADGVHIDVRELDAPGPLTAILGLIDGGRHAGVVIVHHRRQPLFLFPELAERGWSWSEIPGEPGEVRLVLRQGET